MSFFPHCSECQLIALVLYKKENEWKNQGLSTLPFYPHKQYMTQYTWGFLFNEVAFEGLKKEPFGDYVLTLMNHE